MIHRHPSSNQGFAMVLVMVYIFLAVAVVAGVSVAVMSGFRVTNSLEASRKALEAAEYGEVQALTALNSDGAANLGLTEWRKLHAPVSPTPETPCRHPIFGEAGVSPLPVAAVPGAEYVAMTETLDKSDLILVCAAGRCGNAERRIEAVYRPASAENDSQPKRFTRIAWRELPPPR